MALLLFIQFLYWIFKNGWIYSIKVRLSKKSSSLLNDQDVPLERVQKLLGHSDSKTTQIYDRSGINHDKSAAYKIDF